MPTFLPTVADMLKSAVPATPRHGLLFGTTGLGPPYGATAAATYIQDIQTVGGTINRSYFSWDVNNPSPGVFVWNDSNKNVDLWYSSMVNAGITPIMHHIFAPQWWLLHNGWSPSSLPYADWPPYPSSDWNYFMTQNVAAATAAAQRFPLAIIEPCNEWNNGSIYAHPGGTTLAVTAANYAAYFAPISAAYKAVNPNQKIIVGGLLRMDSANFSNWVAGNAIPALLKPALDALGCTPDGVSIHPYMLGAPTSNPSIDIGANILSKNSWLAVGRYLAAQDAAGWHLPVYITETGFRASGFNSQNAFNCNSEATKSIWNRYEHDNTIFQYTKDARPAGKSWVEAMMYYRWQEYPSPTTTSLSGAYPGDPAGGPHPLNAWGASLQDVISRYTNRQSIPVLDSITLTGVPSTAVVGQAAVTISAAGGNIGAIPTLHTTDATVVSLGTPTTGSATTTIAFPAAGTATIYAESTNARRISVSARQTILVAAQIPNASVITPGNGWLVATSNGGTITFTATATDQIGNPIPGVTGTWSSSDATNFPVDPITGIGTAIGVSANVVVTFTPTGGTGGSVSTSTGDVVLNPVLQITNPPSTLINVGAYDLVVTDGVNPVTGYTIVISNATKATQAGGTTLVGKGTSGTFTVKVTKATYNDSALATITCTGDAAGAATNSYFDDKDLAGLTNGVGVSTYTDAGGYAWAQSTSTKRPLANTNDVNGHTSIIYDGVDDYLQATSPVASMNGSGFTYARLCYPTSAAPSANEQQLDNRDTTHTEGFVFGRNTVLNPIISYYTGSTAPHTLSQDFDGSGVFTANAWHVVIDRINQGEQSRMLNGVVVGTSTTLTPYVNATTSPVHPTKGGSIFLSPGNNAAEHVAPEVFVNRGVTDLERLQIHRRITLYQATAGSGGTPAVTTVSVSPSSFTVAAGSTQTLTASSLDQFGNPIADTYTWLSSNTGQATVNSSGVVTGVATGSPTITATSVGNPTKSGTSAATVTSGGGGGVTAVNVSYNTQQAPILARTGSTYTLVAKDQSGNVLTGGTWSSSDATNAPINSSGVASPATGSAGSGITWTYLDVGGVHSGTLTATVLKAATPIAGDIATNYTSDTNFLANVANSVPVNGSYNSNVPTGSGASTYNDGNFCNQIQIDATRFFMGLKTFRTTIVGAIGPTLRAPFTPTQRCFIFNVSRYEPGFTLVGSGGGAAAYKMTPWFTWPGQGNGRVGPETTNGNTSGGTGGAPGGTFDLGVGDPATGNGQSTLTTYAIQGEFSVSNPQYYLDILLYEPRGGNVISARHWHCPMGTAVGTPLDAAGTLPYGIVEGPMAPGNSPYQPSSAAPFGENYNQTALTNLFRNIPFWYVVDGTSVGDPLGIFGTQPTPTLTSITGGTLIHGTNTNTVTFTGTNFNENCFPLFSNAGVLVQSITLNSSTSITAVVNVTSGATLGASTVLIKNSASMTSTSTQAVLIL